MADDATARGGLCLITGGDGFRGRHLVRRLLADGIRVRILDRRPAAPGATDACERLVGDLGDPASLDRALEGVTDVVHLACTSVPKTSESDPAGDVTSNLSATVSLLVRCAARRVRRFVLASSGGTVYGVVPRLPIPETHPAAPISAHGAMKLAQEASQSNFFLLLTGLSETMHDRLMGNWFENESTACVQFMPDLDHGIEWCEERILKEQSLGEAHEGILQQISRYLPSPDDHRILEQYLERREVDPDYLLAKQDEPSDEMFLLQSCTASVYLETISGRRHRIRRAGAGTVYGEVGFYLGTPRTASVIIDKGGELFVLSQEANARLEREHPHNAEALHKFMIRVITRRLQLTTTTLQAVLT